MAKAKSTTTKVVKRSIADTAKEAYLKTHTKEQMYEEYDKLHKRYQETNQQLEETRVDLIYRKDMRDKHEKNATAWRKEYFSMEGLKDHFKDQAEELHKEIFKLQISCVIGYTLFVLTLIRLYV